MNSIRGAIFGIVFILFMAGYLSCGEPRESSSPDRPPNILIFLVDDLGKEWVSCYGAEDIQTPNIDALAERGIRFDNVYAMPQCTPTRVTFLTGQYPFRHGWVNHWDVPRWGGGAHFDETKYPPLVSQLRAAGYRTCIAGKWQIDDFRVEPDALSRVGFDHYCMWTGYESGVPASAERYDDPYVFTSDTSATLPGRFGPDVFRDYIIDFIKADKTAPFFVYYPMVLTHPPLVNTPDESADDHLGKHQAMVRYTDRITGEIVQVLEEEGLREHTVIIWTTDNGTSRGITGQRMGRAVEGAKSQTSEVGVCLPFIVSWTAEHDRAYRSDALIDFTDILPTCLDLAGVDRGTLPSEKPVDGRSFQGVLRSPDLPGPRDWILSMGGGNHARLTSEGVENQYRFRDRVLRNKDFKLYVGSDRQPTAFYQVTDDPWEEVNLLDSLDARKIRPQYEQLWSIVETFPEVDNDPQYDRNPAQVWDVKITAESEVWKK